MISYLDGRTQYVSFNGSNSGIQSISNDVPQGSVLGPILFLIFINDITLSITEPLILFANNSTVINITNLCLFPETAGMCVTLQIKSIKNQ